MFVVGEQTCFILVGPFISFYHMRQTVRVGAPCSGSKDTKTPRSSSEGGRLSRRKVVEKMTKEKVSVSE